VTGELHQWSLAFLSSHLKKPRWKILKIHHEEELGDSSLHFLKHGNTHCSLGFGSAQPTIIDPREVICFTEKIPSGTEFHSHDRPPALRTFYMKRAANRRVRCTKSSIAHGEGASYWLVNLSKNDLTRHNHRFRSSGSTH